MQKTNTKLVPLTVTPSGVIRFDDITAGGIYFIFFIVYLMHINSNNVCEL